MSVEEFIPGTAKMLDERFGRHGRRMSNVFLLAVWLLVLLSPAIPMVAIVSIFRQVFGGADLTLPFGTSHNSRRLWRGRLWRWVGDSDWISGGDGELGRAKTEPIGEGAPRASFDSGDSCGES